jgi:hypothetical protein
MSASGARESLSSTENRRNRGRAPIANAPGRLVHAHQVRAARRQQKASAPDFGLVETNCAGGKRRHRQKSTQKTNYRFQWSEFTVSYHHFDSFFRFDLYPIWPIIRTQTSQTDAISVER